MAKVNLEPSNSTVSSKPLPEAVVQHHGKTLFGPMEEWQSHGKFPPVLLLTGQAGIGKQAMASFLAQWILCEKRNLALNPLTPCGECPTCQRILSKNEVNLIEIESESSNEDSSRPTSGSLKIDQFRKLKTSVGFSAHEGTYKIILIPKADRMTPQAANSILKLLEEPPRGWIFILTSHDPSLLLPTLVSRCQILRLKPFPSETLEKLLILETSEPQRRKICATLAQGSWERAITFAQDDIWEERKVFFQFLQDPASVLHTLVDWASQDFHHLEILIDSFEQFTADFIRWVASGHSNPDHHDWAQLDGKEAFSFHAKRLVKNTGGISAARQFWLQMAERLAQARQQALAPVNQKLFIQDLLIPWIGGKYD